jgi:hypothetical protein
MFSNSKKFKQVAISGGILCGCLDRFLLAQGHF